VHLVHSLEFAGSLLLFEEYKNAILP